MRVARIGRVDSFNAEIESIAPDKSISHRCAIFSLLSNKKSVVRNFLEAEDTLNSLKISEKLGAKVEKFEDRVEITPPSEIKEPDDILDCGNSGTSIRLFSGLLSSIDGFFILTGDKYLRRRPMKRVTNPLRDIGAKIDARESGELAPLAIRGSKLKAFNFQSKIASAQVKSAMILASLSADEPSTYIEPELTRDHSERMLSGMGLEIKRDGLKIEIPPLREPLNPLDIRVPADPSSAFFFAVATAITPKAKLRIKNVTLNPTRIEAFKALQRMGTYIEFIQKENIYEPIGDIYIEQRELKAIEVSENISWLIDELPALSIAFAFAKGVSRVKNAKELRVKESDRITSVVSNLKKCNIKAEEFEDGYEVVGSKIERAKIDSFGDHRIAMSFAIAGVRAGMEIEDIECINTSFPNFFEILSNLGAKVEFRD